jgi:homoserine kinase
MRSARGLHACRHSTHRRYSTHTNALTSRISSITESFFTPVHRVTISVPGTISNLGPGFDCFGFALDVENRVVVERADQFSISIHGEGESGLPRSQENVNARMAAKALEEMGMEVPPLRFECHNAVPPRKGFGSSSAAVVAGLATGLAFGGKDLELPSTKQLLLQMAAEQEGHADNIAPAIYGGFQISCQHTEGQWISQRVNTPPGLQLCLFIPDDEILSEEVRPTVATTTPLTKASNAQVPRRAFEPLFYRGSAPVRGEGRELKKIGTWFCLGARGARGRPPPCPSVIPLQRSTNPHLGHSHI